VAVDPRRLVSRLVAGALLGVALYYALWGGEYSAFDLGRLAERRQAELATLATARAEADSLRHLADLLEDDPAAIEAVAREQFGMIREGEILYRFVHVEPETPADEGAAEVALEP
jgi:cell division protein FtsB